MAKRLAVVLVLLARGAYAAPHSVPSTALFIAAQTSLAVDMLQTLDLKNSRCLNGPQCTWRKETNPILGQTPSDVAILAYFGTVIALQTAMYLWAPPWLSGVASGMTLGIEVPMIGHNFAAGARLSF